MNKIENKSYKTQRIDIIGIDVDVLSWDSTIKKIISWASRNQSKYICITNTSSLVISKKNKLLQKSLKNADMVTPDGMPVALLMRLYGATNQQRINGPDLMLKTCLEASQLNLSIFLLGGTEQVLMQLHKNLQSMFPNLNIAGTYSPPFGDFSETENRKISNLINNSSANLVWVAFGNPKQEIWMSQNSKNINSVLIGVGAAFEFHAGFIKRAPKWMQKYGFEWLHRLFQEPKRLWKRYLVGNTMFVVHSFNQMVKKIFIKDKFQNK